MPAPKFLAGLPKPILFALYGGIGGLLGALAFGELLWHVLKPPPPQPVPQLAVGASASVKLYPHSDNTFIVRIAREHFNSPVNVTFEKLPSGVVIAPLIIPADKTEAEAKVIAAPGAAVGKSEVKIAAASENGSVTASGSISIEVIAPPPPPPEIALAVPSKFEIYQRGTSILPVTITRRQYAGPITVSATSLPPGFSMTSKSISLEKDPNDETILFEKVEVTLSADATAEVGEKELTINALAPELNATQKTKGDVKKPKVVSVPVDIVFVLDVTASMQWAIDDLKNGIGKFAKTLDESQIKFRLGLVTFQDLTIPGEKVEVVMFKNGEKEEPFTSLAMEFRDKTSRLKANGGGDIPESSTEALTEASKLPFRENALKIILLITDAPPKVRDGTVEDKVQATAELLKKSKIDSVHIVVQRQDLDVYKPLMTAGEGKAGGKYFNLGDVVRGDEGFDALLATFSKVVTEAAIITAPDEKPIILKQPPPSPIAAGAPATLKGSEAPPPPSVKGVQSSGQFASGTEARLTLASGIWTAAIAALVCLALLAGQHHYLRGSLPSVGGIAAGLFGGLVVGLVGGAAGQGLFFLAPENETLAHVFRVFGWALLGGLAGVGLSLFIPNMKWTLGLAGGAIGGALGAIGFILLSQMSGDLVGRLVGGLVLGFCIGLMVAVAEAAFRRAWLEVR
ncbi:MAG: VWA domain-containing protein, partial [Planctomycetia bacterium]|nr:VWA domain-containing protein [Planctomycetia bacterium]